MTEGLFEKYEVKKKEGVTDPNAKYFVLRLDTDQLARQVALCYAILVEKINPQLSEEITDLVTNLNLKDNILIRGIRVEVSSEKFGKNKKQ